MHPRLAVEYLWIESEGDQLTDQSLAAAGGKGLFTRAVERALLDCQADIAIHSLKDLPTKIVPGLTIVAIPRRADPRDCLITHHQVATIEDLPHNAVIGTASPRRASQLLERRSDFDIQLLRGNVETRLRKVLEEQQVDATLLAAAGLGRCGLEEHDKFPLDTDIMLPAAGQGALAVQCRIDDSVAMGRCLPLNHAATSAAVHCERAIIAGLSGDCHSPIAVYAQPLEPDAQRYRLRARVLAPDGSQCAQIDVESACDGLTRSAHDAVKALKDQGADQLLVMKPPQRSSVGSGVA